VRCAGIGSGAQPPSEYVCVSMPVSVSVSVSVHPSPLVVVVVVRLHAKHVFPA